MYAAKIAESAATAKFYKDVATRGTFAHKVFTSPSGLSAVSEMNKPENRVRSFVSFGGIGTAHSLAKFYAMLANNGRLEDENRQSGSDFFSEKTLQWMTTTLSDGMDRTFQIPTAFSAGFMKEATNSSKKIFAGSTIAFGHPGAGGSNGFADPENKIGFAYVMNQMEQSVLPNKKSLRLVDAIYE